MIEMETDGIEDHEEVFCLKIAEAIENQTAGIASFLREKLACSSSNCQTF